MPRIKSIESTQAATTSNPQRDFNQASLDPYSWSGIAGASGGREPRTTFGALAMNGDGVDEVYLPSATPSLTEKIKDLQSKITGSHDAAEKTRLTAELDQARTAFAAEMAAASKPGIFNVPEPKNENKVWQYAGSRYLDNEGANLVAQPGVVNDAPVRADLVKLAPVARSSE